MAVFRSVREKAKTVEACRVRLDTPAAKLVDNRGIVAAARLGEWVVREGDANPKVMGHDDFCETYLPIDNAGMVDRGSGVIGIENYDIEAPRRGKKKSGEGEARGTRSRGTDA